VADVPSRQDQLHSYQYSLQRVVAALVTHDPDPHRSPLRRAGTTALVSLVIAMLAVTGAAIWGALQGSTGQNVKDPAVVFLEKGSGAQFVYLDSDKKLHPVLNYTSGLLVANATEPKVVNASRERLADVPLGDPLGIPDAPNSLPTSTDLLPAKWTICSQQPPTTTPTAAPRSLLAVGDQVTDGVLLPVPDTRTLPSQLRGLLVSDSTGQTFLVYANRRFQIPSNRVQQTQTRFGWLDPPLAVATAWINAVPAGPAFAPPTIPGWGDRSPVISDYEIGQILRIPGPSNGTDQWGVVMGDGVANITAVQALLMQTDPEGYDPKDMDANLYGNLPRSKTSLIGQGSAAGFPPAPPALLGRPREGVCLTYTGGSGADGNLSIRLDPTIPTGTAVPTGSAVPGGVQVDVVHVPRGKGALVVAAASPSAPASTGTVSIVTDTGRRYPVASREILGKLGFAGVTPSQVPAQLIALLPAGPSLDAAKARESRPDDGG
jgi:type VII secretion protein EccB